MPLALAIAALEELVTVAKLSVRLAADPDGASLEITTAELTLSRLELIAELAGRHDLRVIYAAGGHLRLVN